MRAAKHHLPFKMIVSSIIAIHISGAATPADPIVPSAAKAAAPATQPTAASVQIDNFAFQPRELKIAVGTTVTWKNGDDVPHTATSKDDPQLFDSGALDTGDTFSFTFAKPGKYTYYCKVHTHMTGVVIVK